MLSTRSTACVLATVGLLGTSGALAEAPPARGWGVSASGGHSSSLRGGAWTHHLADDVPPCGFFQERRDARPPCEFVVGASWWGRRQANETLRQRSAVFSPIEDPSSSADPHVLFALSREALRQLDTLDVDFTPVGFAPTPTDWIGVYCLEKTTDHGDDHQYIDWQWVNASSIVDVGAERRRLSFGPMVNMRCEWEFRYFLGVQVPMGPPTSWPQYTKIGTSRRIGFVHGDTEPLHVRLAPTRDPTAIRVLWVSATVDRPRVRYGTDASADGRIGAAEGATYGADDMCQEPATIVSARNFRDPGMIYDALMTGLTPGGTYYYQVGSDAGGWSEITSFVVPPVPGQAPVSTANTSKTMSFFVYADLGEWTSAATGLSPPGRSGTTMDLVEKELNRAKGMGREYVAVFHDGDLSYARGMAFQWDQFGALIQPVAARLPYLVAMGNHEYDHTSGGEKDPSGAPGNGFHPPEGNYGTDSNGECGVPTARRFHMPENGNTVFWYSTEMGLTHHAVISSEHDFRPGSPMYTWLEADLRGVVRESTPWVFLHLHRPMYCSEEYWGDRTVAELIRRNLEPLMAKYHVDAVFSGHFHAFERTCPVYKEKCYVGPDGRAGAPVHIMVGSAGADVDNAKYSTVAWSVARQLEYGYGRVHIHNATHSQFEFQRNRDGAIADSTWIVSDHAWSV